MREPSHLLFHPRGKPPYGNGVVILRDPRRVSTGDTITSRGWQLHIDSKEEASLLVLCRFTRTDTRRPM